MKDFGALFAVIESLSRKTEFRFPAEALAYSKAIEFIGRFAEYQSLLIQRELDREREVENELDDRATFQNK